MHVDREIDPVLRNAGQPASVEHVTAHRVGAVPEIRPRPRPAKDDRAAEPGVRLELHALVPRAAGVLVEDAAGRRRDLRRDERTPDLGAKDGERVTEAAGDAAGAGLDVDRLLR